jgi:TolA-binding protein
VDSITDGQRQLLDDAVDPGHRSPIAVSGDNGVVSAGGLQPADNAILSADAKARPDVASPSAAATPERAVRAGSPKLLARLDPPGNGGSHAFVARVPSAALPAAASAPPSPSPSPAPATLPLEQALDLVRSYRYPEAERALEALSSGGGPGADIALYELANVRRRYLGDVAGALAALQRYQTAYPQGALLQETEISMIELELASPDPGAALSQINRFLSAYPNSERTPEVYWLRGNLLRAHRDFAGALESYQRVQGGDREEEALYFRAVCQERLGQIDAAAETLRTYLQRFPSASHAADARRALAGR